MVVEEYRLRSYPCCGKSWREIEKRIKRNIKRKEYKKARGIGFFICDRFLIILLISELPTIRGRLVGEINKNKINIKGSFAGCANIHNLFISPLQN